MRFVAVLSAIASLLGIEIDTVTVDLYSNSSSGYIWECSFDKSGILIMEDSFFKPDPGSILARSGGGTRSFVLKSIGCGTVKATFEYVKNTGTERIVASKYIYTYNVSEDGKISLYSIQ